MAETLTADGARQWAVFIRAAFAMQRARIDALNVFPVADSDTGSNLFHSLDRALSTLALAQASTPSGENDLGQQCRALADALLETARGNSGVLLSQLVAGFAGAVTTLGARALTGAQLAVALRYAAVAARAALVQPVEGTMVTVAEELARGAETAAGAGDIGADQVIAAALPQAEQALARTREQLEPLRAAGVVDAGGAGLVLIVQALYRVLVGRWPSSAALTCDEPRPGVDRAEADTTDFEVMYVLVPADSIATHRLRSELDRLGDSVLVGGGPDRYSVHVHTTDAGAVIEAGLHAGSVSGIRVGVLTQAVAHPPRVNAIEVIACAVGPGLAEAMRSMGVHPVLSEPDARASTDQLLEAAKATGAAAIVIVAQDRFTEKSAQIAARALLSEGIDASVVPARAAVQSLAALAVYDPASSLHAAVQAMTGAAAATRHGGISVATHPVLTWAGPVAAGDVLGIISSDVAFIASEPSHGGVEVIRRLLSGGGELVTLIVGDGGGEVADSAQEWLRENHREIEIQVIDGGQQRYPLLIGVE